MSAAGAVHTGDSRTSHFRFIAILGALTALGPLSNDAYLPGLPDIAHDLHTSASATQLSLTACLLGLGSGQLLAGPLSDALGRRRPLIAGLLLYVVSSLAAAVVPSIWLFVVFRLLQGIGGATGIVIAAAVVRDRHTGAAAARFFSLLLLVTGLAPILAPVAGGQLLRLTSWQGIFVALAAAGAVMAAAVAMGLPETLPVERRQSGGLRAMVPIFRQLLADRDFVGYALSCGFGFAAMFVYIAGSPFVLQVIHRMTPQEYSGVFAMNALGLVIAAQVSGRIVNRVGPRRLLAVGVAGSALGGLIVLTAVLAGAGLVPLLVGLFVAVASVGLIMPNSTALALGNYGKVAGAAAALIGLAQHFIGAAAAPLAGLAGARSAMPMAVVITILGFSALLSFGLLTRSRQRTSAPEAPAASLLTESVVLEAEK
ncbi:MAG: multidrug effflux MFS transporter [Pseudonocardiales bacterium]|nr:multidrug effflux MFS transporter [Pseudonocardiales bacterium]MBV9030593.1 multidrug effflux MFS transporter [Pseudonocardiales bacterium]